MSTSLKASLTWNGNNSKSNPGFPNSTLRYQSFITSCLSLPLMWVMCQSFITSLVWTKTFQLLFSSHLLKLWLIYITIPSKAASNVQQDDPFCPQPCPCHSTYRTLSDNNLLGTNLNVCTKWKGDLNIVIFFITDSQLVWNFQHFWWAELTNITVCIPFYPSFYFSNLMKCFEIVKITIISINQLQ